MNLDYVPVEVITAISKWLNIADILRLRSTCKAILEASTPPYSLHFKAYKESLKYFNSSSLLHKLQQLIKLESSLKPPRSQLLFLARRGHLDLLRIITQHAYPQSFIQELFAITASHSEYYHGKITLTLLKNHPYLNINLPSHPLLAASTTGNPDLVELLLTYPIPPQTITASLHLSVRHNHPSCLKPLLSHPDSTPSLNDLILGCTLGYLKIVKLLILDGRITPTPECLIRAAEGGFLLLTIILLDHPVSEGLEQSLYLSHINHHPEVTRLMYTKSKQVHNSLTCIKFVVKVGYLPGLCELLGEIGDVDGQDGVLCRLAVKYGQKECLRVLLDDGRCDPSHRGNLALRMARERGDVEMVEMLMGDERVTERMWIDNAVPEKWIKGLSLVSG